MFGAVQDSASSIRGSRAMRSRREAFASSASSPVSPNARTASHPGT